MLDEHVEFLERAGIEQHVQPLARRQLALGMLRVDAALAAAQPRGRRRFSSSCNIFCIQTLRLAESVFRQNPAGLACDIAAPGRTHVLDRRPGFGMPPMRLRERSRARDGLQRRDCSNQGGPPDEVQKKRSGL
jgi:hypothetical protein